MQGYTYVKGEHYPVEHLVFTTAPEHVQEFLDVDHEVWTLGEAESGLFDHIPFLYKEVWVNDNKPGEMHFIFVWESIESWKKVDDPDLQAKFIANFESKFQHPYRSPAACRTRRISASTATAVSSASKRSFDRERKFHP